MTIMRNFELVSDKCNLNSIRTSRYPKTHISGTTIYYFVVVAAVAAATNKKNKIFFGRTYKFEFRLTC